MSARRRHEQGSMKLIEVFDKAMPSLNSGGVPVVLSRLSSGLQNAVRVFEVRIRWTGPSNPLTSDRGSLLVDKRRRTDEGWSTWGPDETPFSVDDMLWPYWEVRYPDHVGRSGHPCPACAQEEVRTDPEMIEIYGRVTAKHTCGMQSLTE